MHIHVLYTPFGGGLGTGGGDDILAILFYLSPPPPYIESVKARYWFYVGR